MSEPRLMNNMVTTANDYLVMTGGFTDLMLTPGQTLDAFEPSGEMKSDMTSLSVARAGHAVIDVTGGRVLMAGGIGPEDLLRSAELFTP